MAWRTLYWPPHPASILCCDPRQVDVAFHGWERLDLASGPAALAMPQARVRALAQPPVPARLPDHPFVVVNVGHATHRGHAGLQHLWGQKKSCRPPWGRAAAGPGGHVRDGAAPLPACASWRAAAQWPSRSLSSAAPHKSLQRAREEEAAAPSSRTKHLTPWQAHPRAGNSPKTPAATALCATLLPEDRTSRKRQDRQNSSRRSGGLVCTLTRGEGRRAAPGHPELSSPSALSQMQLQTAVPSPGDAPAARIYCAPFPGWLSKLQISVPMGRAPSG